MLVGAAGGGFDSGGCHVNRCSDHGRAGLDRSGRHTDGSIRHGKNHAAAASQQGQQANKTNTQQRLGHHKVTVRKRPIFADRGLEGNQGRAQFKLIKPCQLSAAEMLR